MAPLTRDQVQAWIDEAALDSYICPDCDGIHLPSWEAKEGVLEARCFVENQRCSLLIEIAIRPSAVLPLQGAIHFMNFDFSLSKVMISMVDNDIPRLLLTHAIPSEFLSEDLFKDWLNKLLVEMDQIYNQLTDMEVLQVDNEDFDSEFDDQLH